MARLAIIPARLGSKRIPRKNIRDFLGKPIIAYSIEVAIKSNLFDRVMVSTDSEVISKIGERYGAEAPFLRSAKNSGDNATTVEVLLEVIDKYRDLGLEFEEICCLYPTAPFVTPSLLRDGFEKLRKDKYDTVFPVIQYGNPIQRALKMSKNHQLSLFTPEYLHRRSQDLEPAFYDAGQFYCCFVSAILKKKKLWTDNTGGLIISEMQAHDIDTEDDWQIAEFKYEVIHGRSS